MKTNIKSNAVLAERLFIVAIIGLIVVMIFNFIFVTKLLSKQSLQANQTKTEADISTNDIKTIQSATKKLKAEPSVVKKAASVVAQSKLYQYQNQIINDLQDYAKQNGVSIKGYSFSAADATSAAGGAPSSTTPPASAGAPTGSSQPGQTPTPTGVSSTNVSVTLDDKVKYILFLNFVRSIENNVTRMQINNIDLSPESKDPSILLGPTLTITVYTR